MAMLPPQSADVAELLSQIREGGSLPTAAAMAVSLLSALAISVFCKLACERHGEGANIHRSFPLLSVAVTTIFSCMWKSIPLALALFGAISVIRFRTSVKKPLETAYALLCVAAAVSSATWHWALVAATIAIAAVIPLLAGLSRWRSKDGRISISVGVDAPAEFQCELEKVLSSSTHWHSLESACHYKTGFTYKYAFSGLRCGDAFFLSCIQNLCNSVSTQIELLK